MSGLNRTAKTNTSATCLTSGARDIIAWVPRALDRHPYSSFFTAYRTCYLPLKCAPCPMVLIYPASYDLHYSLGFPIIASCSYFSKSPVWNLPLPHCLTSEAFKAPSENLHDPVILKFCMHEKPAPWVWCCPSEMYSDSFCHNCSGCCMPWNLNWENSLGNCF